MFICPKCSENTLLIEKSVQVTPLNPMSNDELVQAISCPCGFTGLGLYKESSAGASESINHDGYELSEQSYHALLEILNNPQELAKIYATSFADSPVEVNWRGIFGLKRAS